MPPASGELAGGMIPDTVNGLPLHALDRARDRGDGATGRPAGPGVRDPRGCGSGPGGRSHWWRSARRSRPGSRSRAVSASRRRSSSSAGRSTSWWNATRSSPDSCSGWSSATPCWRSWPPWLVGRRVCPARHVGPGPRATARSRGGRSVWSGALLSRSCWCSVRRRSGSRPIGSATPDPRRSGTRHRLTPPDPSACQSRSPSRLSSSRRNDATRTGIDPPRGDGEVEPALRRIGAMGAATRAVGGRLGQVGERLQQPVGVDVGQPERPDARSVHDPPAARQRESDRRRRGVPPPTGDHVDPTGVAPGTRHQGVDQCRLAHARVTRP